MLTSAVFFFLRILEILTLIPIWGILAYFVNQYTAANETPPDTILCLFVVAILATAWAILTLFLFHGIRFTDLWIAVIDLCFFGILIAGVVLLGRIAANTDCVQGWADYNGFGVNYGTSWQKSCMMYKAAYGLGILNILLFFLTACAAALIWRGGRTVAYTERRGGYF